MIEIPLLGLVLRNTRNVTKHNWTLSSLFSAKLCFLKALMKGNITRFLFFFFSTERLYQNYESKSLIFLVFYASNSGLSANGSLGPPPSFPFARFLVPRLPFWSRIQSHQRCQNAQNPFRSAFTIFLVQKDCLRMKSCHVTLLPIFFISKELRHDLLPHSLFCGSAWNRN